MRDMEAYFAAITGLAKEEIAARQLRPLREYLRPSDGKLRVNDIHEMFETMGEHQRGRSKRQ
jgi:hypothetical protein